MLIRLNIYLSNLYISLYSSEFNLEVFRIFVELHDFEGRLLVDGLR